jgi:hypothetical protein
MIAIIKMITITNKMITKTNVHSFGPSYDHAQPPSQRLFLKYFFLVFWQKQSLRIFPQTSTRMAHIPTALIHSSVSGFLSLSSWHFRDGLRQPPASAGLLPSSAATSPRPDPGS